MTLKRNYFTYKQIGWNLNWDIFSIEYMKVCKTFKDLNLKRLRYPKICPKLSFISNKAMQNIVTFTKLSRISFFRENQRAAVFAFKVIK